MATYTPYQEIITGASLTGSDGDANRTYTLSNSGSIAAQMTIILAGQALINTVDYTKSGDTITFIPNVDDDMNIVIDYFTSSTDSLSSTSQKRYCTIDDAYRTAGITSSEISNADVEYFILEAESRVDRLTNTTYWQKADSGTATSSTSTSLTDSSKDWSSYDYTNDLLWIYDGTGEGQVRLITTNGSTSLTVDEAWDTNPSTDSLYRIIHTGTHPYIDQDFTGDNRESHFLGHYPLRLLVSATVDGTSITTSSISTDSDIGRLILNTSTEKGRWSNRQALLNNVKYWYGVWNDRGDVPLLVRRLTVVYAALSMLEAQMGGTHNIPSSYQLPELSVVVGQAYVNIKGTHDVLSREAARIEAIIPKYSVVA